MAQLVDLFLSSSKRMIHVNMGMRRKYLIGLLILQAVATEHTRSEHGKIVCFLLFSSLSQTAGCRTQVTAKTCGGVCRLAIEETQTKAQVKVQVENATGRLAGNRDRCFDGRGTSFSSAGTLNVCLRGRIGTREERQRHKSKRSG